MELKQNRIHREIILNGDDTGIKLIGDYEIYRIKKVQAYIGIRGESQYHRALRCPSGGNATLPKVLAQRPLNDIRVPHTKWVVLRWPLPAMAQQAQMSTEAFEDYYFDVCTLDYSRMERAMVPLKSLMEETDDVHIVGEDTDLRFSIKDIPVIPCAGEKNIPDGECFTRTPCETPSMVLSTSTHPTIYQGTTFTDIRLRFENGKIVEATANNTERLNDILDTDEGARYIGEFSIAFNPYITNPNA